MRKKSLEIYQTCESLLVDAGAARSRGGLWVERYAPRSFFDLLSDETINREVVRWLKSWDACVFRGGPAKAQSGPLSGRGGAGGAAPDAGSKGDRRPEHKVLLLCGAPGRIPPCSLL